MKNLKIKNIDSDSEYAKLTNMNCKKNILAFVFLLMFVFKSQAQTEAHPFGLGIMIGNPAAITGKYILNKNNSVAGGLSISSSDYTLIYTDYLYHVHNLFTHKNQFLNELTPYIGFGGLLASTNKDRSNDDHYLGKKSGNLGLGVRVPLGSEWNPKALPLGVFLEIVPGMSVVPTMDAFI